EVATISAPDPHMLTIVPWDQSVLEGIQKAIMSSQQGINPIADGKMIRISIPALTGEKRQELVKQVAQKIESGRQMLRNERVDIKKKIEGQKGDAGVSEDDIKQELVKLEE